MTGYSHDPNFLALSLDSSLGPDAVFSQRDGVIEYVRKKMASSANQQGS
jgi:hypothetical protein